MKKNLKLVIAFIILLVAAFLYAHIDKTNYIYDKSIDSSEYISTGIIVDKKIEQVFRCEEDVLDGVRVKCGVFGDVGGITLKYYLKDNKTGKIIAEDSVDATQVKNSKFFDLKFKQIENSKNVDYKFVVEELYATPDKGISFYKTEQVESKNKLFVGDEEVNGTLVLKAISHKFDLETFIIILCFALYIVVFMKFLYRLFK